MSIEATVSLRAARAEVDRVDAMVCWAMAQALDETNDNCPPKRAGRRIDRNVSAYLCQTLPWKTDRYGVLLQASY
jgi:hypothetical protein